MEASYDYTPRLYRKLVFSATQCGSFAEAARMLRELLGLKMPAKRLWRATKRIGEERVKELRQAAAAYQQLPLPQQQQSPSGVETPQVACVQMDGGRLQIRPRGAEASATEAEESASCWREMKVGCLASLKSEVSLEDPCPELPATFVDPGRMREMAREIKGFTSPSILPSEASDQPPRREKERAGRPQVLLKSVVASVRDIESFAPLLASAAHARGFSAASRKAFVGDGSETIWGAWRKYFSHYTPIVDFVHALMYVYAAALAGHTLSDGWKQYRDWASWLWSGAVERIIAAIQERQQELGLPEAKEEGTPRALVAESLRYLQNQQERMNYAEYRKQGLPITSTLIESTIMQVNRRMKGTEKFWDVGAEAMLSLVADHLSQTTAVSDFWHRHTDRITDSWQLSA